MAETGRVVLRRFALEDAPFVLRLLNEPGFLRYIGDRGVRTDADARAYLEAAALESYRVNGYGPFLVERRRDGAPIGMCGLMRKPWLDAPDLAYAISDAEAGRGYASEAARAVLEQAWSELALDRVVAVVLPENRASLRVLEKLRFRKAGRVQDPRNGADLVLLSLTPDPRSPGRAASRRDA